VKTSFIRPPGGDGIVCDLNVRNRAKEKENQR
jgi:hypothetical protein